MSLDMVKLRSVVGYAIGSTTIREIPYGCATVPANDESGRAFQKLVGLMNQNGVWVWVAKSFRKS